MKQAICCIAAAAVFLLSGCGENEYVDKEALAFGYSVQDSQSTNLVFLVTPPATTNWVPERTLGVVSSYEWTADELALVAEAQTVVPADELKEIPPSFAKDMSGAWFTYWEKQAKCFGENGTSGFIAHFDDGKNIWQTGESYFSCYWPTREAAIAARDRIKAAVAARFSPKKFHEFGDGWIAEYVRLCVTCVVGRKSDGRWSCMFDMRDKCRPGCGMWESEEDQQSRFDNYNYAKAMNAWRAGVEKAVQDNHDAVAKAMAEAGLTGFSAGVRVQSAPDGRRAEIVMQSGKCAAAQALWDEQTSAAVKAFGGVVGEPVVEKGPDAEYRWAEWKGEFHDMRIDMAVAASKEGGEPEAGWRIIAIERLLPGCVLPAVPERPGTGNGGK